MDELRRFGSRWYVFAAMVLFLLVACKRDDSGAPRNEAPTTGAIVARAIWPETGAPSALATIPVAVITVRAIVDAVDMEIVQRSFPAAAGSGTLGGIPAGTNRTLTLQGLNGSGTPIFQGDKPGIDVIAGETADAGIILMAQVPGATPPAPVTGFTATPGNATVTLSWINPGDIDLAGVRILRREDGVSPASPLDGALVYEGAGTNASDATVVNDTTYHYTAFAYDSAPYYSAGSSANATPSVAAGNNTAPVALNANKTTDEDVPVAITLQGFDADGNPLTFRVETNPAHGALSGTLPDLSYTPAGNYFGPDTFTFRANDGIADSNLGTVDLTVNPVNDPPQVVGFPDATVNEDTAYAFTPTAIDVEGNAVTYSIQNKPTWAAFNTANGTFTGTPGNGNVGITTGIVITATDNGSPPAAGTLGPFSIEVINVNDAPVPVTPPNRLVWQATAVTLDASASYDIDLGASLTFAWSQTGGTPVSLAGAGTDTATFTAPPAPDSLAFSLTVDDGLAAPVTVPVVVTVIERVPLATGTLHMLYLKPDGTLWAWGDNVMGKLGLGDTQGRAGPEQIGTDSDWVAAAAGYYQSFALRNDGTLWGWGLNYLVPTQVGTSSDWKVLSTTGDVSFGLKIDGTLWSWGVSSTGALGRGGLVSGGNRIAGPPGEVFGSDGVNPDSDWVMISAGGRPSFEYALALKSDGTLWSWGSNEWYKLGDGTNANHGVPAQVVGADGVNFDSDWQFAEAGEQHALALKTNGTLWAWGNGGSGQLGRGNLVESHVPVEVLGADGVNHDSDWQAIVSGFGHSLAKKNDGSLWAWGSNLTGQLGDGGQLLSSVPVQVLGADGVNPDLDWVWIFSANTTSYAAKSDGSLWSWGTNAFGLLGIGEFSDKADPLQINLESDWTAVSAAGSSLALKSDGTLWSWGAGTLGIVESIYRQIPGQVMGSDGVNYDSDWDSIAKMMGGLSSYAGKDDGLGGRTLWAWGDNQRGQLGQGEPWPWPSQSTPLQVLGADGITYDSDWTSFDAGYGHVIALKADGTLWSWGTNTIGQLGRISSESCLGGSCSTLAGQVGTESTWTEIAAGYYHNLALMDDGAGGKTLWSWGYNGFGQLGMGDSGAGTERTVPTQVLGIDGINYDHNWSAVFAGYHSSFALKSDGILWAWGLNTSHELGLGTTTNMTLPTQVPESDGVSYANDWLAVSGGDGFSVALKTGGTLWRSGYDTINPTSTTFVRIGTDSGFLSVSCGSSHTLALKDDGAGGKTLWAWGSNIYGQLGDGSAWKTAPVQVVFPP